MYSPNVSSGEKITLRNCTVVNCQSMKWPPRNVSRRNVTRLTDRIPSGLIPRGKPQLVKDGYAYVQAKRGRDETIYWRCETKKNLSCKGRMKTESNKITAYSSSHNHAPDLTCLQVVKALTDLKTKPLRVRTLPTRLSPRLLEK